MYRHKFVYMRRRMHVFPYNNINIIRYTRTRTHTYATHNRCVYVYIINEAIHLCTIMLKVKVLYKSTRAYDIHGCVRK